MFPCRVRRFCRLDSRVRAGGGRLCGGCRGVELIPVFCIFEAGVRSGPAADTGGVLNNAVRVEKTIKLKVRVEFIEPSVVFAPPPQRTEVLAVLLCLDVVTEANKSCPVTIAGERLTTAADTPTCSLKLA